MARYFSVLVVSLLSGPLFAATIKGRVTDVVRGDGIPGVTVSAAEDRRRYSDVLTDAEGHYSIGSVPRGARVTLTFSRPGYQAFPTVRSDVPIDNDPKELSVRLIREQDDTAYFKLFARILHEQEKDHPDEELRLMLQRLTQERQSVVAKELEILRANATKMKG
jgi:Carboxypeptidase regulatory-like domain